MKNNFNTTLQEFLCLCKSLIKWLFLAGIVGLSSGAVCTLFIKLIEVICNFTYNFDYFYVFMPVSFLVATFLIKVLAPNANGHGTERVIGAFNQNNGLIYLKVVPVKLTTTLITLSTGGSVGKEGPSVQIGAGIASFIANLFNLNVTERKMLVLCGVSAGFATVFGTPIAGAIFALEVMVIGKIFTQAMLPVIFSSFLAITVAKIFNVHYFFTTITVPTFDNMILLNSIFASVFVILVTFILIFTMHYLEVLYNKIKLNIYIKSIIGGVTLVILTLCFGKNYLGLGDKQFDNILENGIKIGIYACFLKILFSAITLNWGGSGGLFTPMFYIGITAGASLGGLIYGDIRLYGAIGLITIIAAGANSPITAIILGVELFGASGILYYATAAALGTYLIGHNSLFPTQLIKYKKSNLLNIDLNKPIENSFSRKMTL